MTSVAILIAYGIRLRRQVRPHVRVYLSYGNVQFMEGLW